MKTTTPYKPSIDHAAKLSPDQATLFSIPTKKKLEQKANLTGFLNVVLVIGLISWAILGVTQLAVTLAFDESARIPWHDYVLGLIAMSVFVFLSSRSEARLRKLSHYLYGEILDATIVEILTANADDSTLSVRVVIQGYNRMGEELTDFGSIDASMLEEGLYVIGQELPVKVS